MKSERFSVPVALKPIVYCFVSPFIPPALKVTFRVSGLVTPSRDGKFSYYDLTEPIPEDMTKLLRQIDDSASPATKNGAADAGHKQKDKEPKSD